MPLKVVESSLRSRAGDPESSADVLLVTPRLVGLLSGVATVPDSTPLDLPEGMGLARYAATVGAASLRAIDPEWTLPEVVGELSTQLGRALERIGAPQGAGYAFALVNGARREVWRVGAMHVLREGLGAAEETGLPPSLLLAAHARALILHALLSKAGEYDQASLKAADPSQVLIAPLLAAHASLANSERALGYGLINGADVPAQHQHLHKLLLGAREVVLASIGYPYPRGTLAASEHALNELLRDDPLLIERFPFVRAAKPTQEGYADRAYLRVRVW